MRRHCREEKGRSGINGRRKPLRTTSSQMMVTKNIRANLIDNSGLEPEEVTLQRLRTNQSSAEQ